MSASICADGPPLASKVAAAPHPARRQVLLQDGRALPYDVVSLNIGSLLVGADGEAARYAERIKPLHRAARIEARLKELAEGGKGGTARVVVIGAGAGGVAAQGSDRPALPAPLSATGGLTGAAPARPRDGGRAVPISRRRCAG